MSNFIQTQLTRNIVELKKVFTLADIYGCDIKLRSKNKETDWIIINDEQVLQLIETYEKRLQNEK